MTRPARRSVLRALVVAACALLLVGGGLSAAQANSARTADTVAALRSQRGKLPPITGGTDSAAYVVGRAYAAKAKTSIDITQTLLRTYANETFRQTPTILYSRSPAWAVTHLGPHPRFGYFPTTRAKILGFGAIPVKAHLHLHQIVRHHLIVPLVINTSTGLAPPYPLYPTHVTGPLILRVSNVEVDQVPLDVGPNCHTVTPIHLHLTGLSPGYGLFTGGPLNGKISIPSFTNCHDGGQNLDPLLTGMISGPGNVLHTVQGVLGTWNTDQPHDCKGCTIPKLPPRS